jgi:hypothetical protein
MSHIDVDWQAYRIVPNLLNESFRASAPARRPMTVRAHFASRLFAILILCVFLLGVTPQATAKDDWQSDLYKWVVSSDTNLNCKAYYTTAVYTPDMGSQPLWGMMTEKMFRYFSRDGVKLAPSVCPVSRTSKDRPDYLILSSVSPMKTVSQTTHGSEVQTTTQPFNASINSRTTYSDGSTANGTATVNGEQTTTVVVPTETTISRSSVAEYMYAYRINGDQLELIGTDSVVYSRVAASGSGDSANYAAIGAGIGNLIRAGGDRRREDKLYEEALKAIRAHAQDNRVKQDALPVNHASAPIVAQVSPAVIVPIPAPATPSAPAIPAQASLNIDSIPTGADIEIDGAFVGDTPSAVSVAPGSHQIVVSKKGFTDWSRTLNVTGGSVHLNAELEQKPTSSESVPSAQSIDTSQEQSATEDAETQFHRGGLYETGKGVPQDYAQAVLWYRKAAEQNLAIAQYRLGVLYANGVGVPLDKSQAASWFQKAADQGYVYAQEMLGMDYLTGEGV